MCQSFPVLPTPDHFNLHNKLAQAMRKLRFLNLDGKQDFRIILLVNIWRLPLKINWPTCLIMKSLMDWGIAPPIQFNPWFWQSSDIYSRNMVTKGRWSKELHLWHRLPCINSLQWNLSFVRLTQTHRLMEDTMIWLGYNILNKTQVFRESLISLKNRPLNEKTCHNFQSHFRKAYQDLKKVRVLNIQNFTIAHATMVNQTA